jgi:two-component system, NtrC family, sensor kinase
MVEGVGHDVSNGDSSMRWSPHIDTSSRRQIAAFARVYAAAAAVFLLVLHGFFVIQARIDDERAKVAMHGAVDYAADVLAATLASYASDIKVLSHLGKVRSLAVGDLSARAEVINYFRIFVGDKPITAQLRFIDATGRELVRVDRIGDEAVVIPDEDLQDKSDRYYFQKAIGLPETEIYVSPVDLNIEHDAIEIPWNPMLRLARALRDSSGAALGIVIVNIKAAEMIAGIERVQIAGAPPVQWLNGAGYWLAGASPDRLWGFMFGRETTMAKTDPAAWAIVGPDPADGAFEIGSTAYVYQSIAPTTLISEAPDAEQRGVGLDDWKVVGEIRLGTFAKIWNLRHIGLAAAGLLLVGGICYGWSRAHAARRSAEANQRAAEEELVRVERFASLGSLVAGVAHELNTPVGSAVTVASTMAERVAAFRTEVEAGQLRRAALGGFLDDMREGTEIMLRGLERTARLVQQFKQVAFDQTSQQRRAFSLAEVVADVVGTMQPQFNHVNIDVRTAIATQTRLDSYPGPLGQVLINLISNARTHAFDDGVAGTITISARDTAAGMVEIAVRDTGKGMSDDVRKRIFEPFFTTRLGLGGSGLGLSITFNIVSGILGGTIRAESAPGKGTAMIVEIPAVAPADSSIESGRIYDVGR